MKLDHLPTGMIDWTADEPEIQPGETGIAKIRMRQFGTTRIRVVEFSENYLGDHWCHDGHIVLVLSGTLIMEHRNDRSYTLTAGMTYHVGTNYVTPHRARCDEGATVFAID